MTGVEKLLIELTQKVERLEALLRAQALGVPVDAVAPLELERDYPVYQIAKMLGRGCDFVLRQITAGKLKARKINGKYRVTMRAVAEWQQALDNPAPRAPRAQHAAGGMTELDLRIRTITDAHKAKYAGKKAG